MFTNTTPSNVHNYQSSEATIDLLIYSLLYIIILGPEEHSDLLFTVQSMGNGQEAV